MRDIVFAHKANIFINERHELSLYINGLNAQTTLFQSTFGWCRNLIRSVHRGNIAIMQSVKTYIVHKIFNIHTHIHTHTHRQKYEHTHNDYNLNNNIIFVHYKYRQRTVWIGQFWQFMANGIMYFFLYLLSIVEFLSKEECLFYISEDYFVLPNLQ